MDPILHQFKSDIEPRQVNIFVSKMFKIDRKQINYVYKKISREFAIASVFNVTRKNVINLRAMTLGMVRRPTASVVTIVLVDERNFKNLSELMPVIFFHYQYRARRKCLILLFCQKKCWPLKKEFRTTLSCLSSMRQGDQKFIDLTTLVLQKGQKPRIFYFQPFYKIFVDHVLLNSTLIFPNKLKNANGLNFSVFRQPNSITGLKRKLRNFQTDDLYYLKDMFGKFFNFTVITDGRGFDLATIPFRFIPNRRFPDFNYQIHVKVVGVAIPHLERILKVREKYKIVIPFLGFFSILVAFFKISKYFKFSKKVWSVINIFKCLLMLPLMIKSNFKERSLYLCLCTVSFLFVSNMFSMIFDQKFDLEEKSIQSYKELNSLNLTVYCSNPYFWMYLKDKKTCIHKENLHEDLHKLAKFNDRICLDYLDNIKITSALLSIKHSTRDIKVADALTQEMVFGNTWGMNSPYVDIFNLFYLHAMAAGFMDTRSVHNHILEEYHFNIDRDFDYTDDNQYFFIFTLVILVAVGFCLATVAFLWELRQNLLVFFKMSILSIRKSIFMPSSLKDKFFDIEMKTDVENANIFGPTTQKCSVEYNTVKKIRVTKQMKSFEKEFSIESQY